MQAKVQVFHEDPQDKKFLTRCFVCQDISKPGQEHLRNYGGIVCYSCRAFWRRSHQNSRNPKFICKKVNQCVLTVATRRSCQKCRYERCLVAGMRPEAVLDMEQKKIRFRKLLKKQHKFLLCQMKGKVEMPTTLRYFPSSFKLESRQANATRNAKSSHENYKINTPNEDEDDWMKSFAFYSETPMTYGQQQQPDISSSSHESHWDEYSKMESSVSRWSSEMPCFKSQAAYGVTIDIVEMTQDFVKVMNRIG
jgi:hypothetical protein